MRFIGRIFRRQSRAFEKVPRGAVGARAYAIGDIHGRLDLLENLLRKIEAEIARSAPEKVYIVFLGDLIDRGPDSAGVLERLSTYSPPRAIPIFLAGNHEEVLLNILAGKEGVLRPWLKFGGAECAKSYGIEAARLSALPEHVAIHTLRDAIPAPHEKFLKRMVDTFRFGDYLFVHAGLRPGVALDQQNRADLRWIREPFLSSRRNHGSIVVHGHTIVERVDERPNRIAIDTGAYRSGVLTALVVDNDRRWYVATGGNEREDFSPASP